MFRRFSVQDFFRWLQQRRAMRRHAATGGQGLPDHPSFYDEYGNRIPYEAGMYSGCLVAILVVLVVVVFAFTFWVCDPFGGGDGDLITTPTIGATSSTTSESTTSTMAATTTTVAGLDLPATLSPLLDPLAFDPAQVRRAILSDLFLRITGLIDSISDNEPGYEGPELDIVDAFILWGRAGQIAVDRSFNQSVYECGATDPLVVCAFDVQDMPEGEILVVAVRHEAPIPTDSTERSYIYSLVFESDGDPANDWVFNPPFDWDFFQGTDRWYEAIYEHANRTWILGVTQVSEGNELARALPSAVRVVIVDEWVIWFVPSTEIPDFPGRLRAVAFGHDGNFTEATRGGDVTGADPTEPPFDPEG